jgi:hypothetical protein
VTETEFRGASLGARRKRLWETKDQVRQFRRGPPNSKRGSAPLGQHKYTRSLGLLDFASERSVVSPKSVITDLWCILRGEAVFYPPGAWAQEEGPPGRGCRRWRR